MGVHFDHTGMPVSVGHSIILAFLLKGSQCGSSDKGKQIWSLIPQWQVTSASWQLYFPINKIEFMSLEGGLLRLEKTCERHLGAKE